MTSLRAPSPTVPIGITHDSTRQANHMFVSSCSSKKESELAAWEFMKTEMPAFGLTVFLPPLIFVPPMQPVKGSKHLTFSLGVFYSLWHGRNDPNPNAPQLHRRLR